MAHRLGVSSSQLAACAVGMPSAFRPLMTTLCGDFMHEEDGVEGQLEPGSTHRPRLAGAVAPFVAILFGELVAYAVARLFTGNPAEHGLHGGSQIAGLVLLSMAAGGQLVGAIVWGLLARTTSPTIVPVVGGLLAGLAAAIVLAVWSAIDQMAFFGRPLHVEEALLSLACCGIPGGLSGMACGALGAVTLRARGKQQRHDDGN